MAPASARATRSQSRNHSPFDLLSEDDVRLIAEKCAECDRLPLALASRLLHAAVLATHARTICRCAEGLLASRGRGKRDDDDKMLKQGHVCFGLIGCVSSVARISWLRTALNMPLDTFLDGPSMTKGEWTDTYDYLYTDSKNYPMVCMNDLCSAAACLGKLDVLQYLQQEGCQWDANTCIGAARHGLLEVLKWARSRGCRLDNFDHVSVFHRSFRICADPDSGGMHCLPRYAPATTMDAAASGGHLAVLKWLVKTQDESCTCTVDHAQSVLQAAAFEGRLEVLRWAARTPKASRGLAMWHYDCPGRRNIIKAALWGAQLAVLQLIERAGCPVVHETARDWWDQIRGDVSDPGDYGPAMGHSAFGGRWESCHMGAVMHHVPMLAWLADSCAIVFDEWACALAALYGELTTLQWLRARHVPWDARTCTQACIGGQHGQASLATLTWAREHGCEWEGSALFKAVGTDFQELQGQARPILSYLKGHKCPGGETLCAWAAEDGALATLKLAVELGFAFDLDECLQRAGHPTERDYDENHDDTMDWLQTQADSCWNCDVAGPGCPKPKASSPELPCPYNVWVCWECDYCVCEVCADTLSARRTRMHLTPCPSVHPHPLYCCSAAEKGAPWTRVRDGALVCEAEAYR